MRKLNAAKLAQTLVLLNENPITAAQLATEVNIHIVTAQSWLRELYKQRAIYIHAWLPDSLGRDCTPVYAINRDGLDVDTPRRTTKRAEIARRYREKKRECASCNALEGYQSSILVDQPAEVFFCHACGKEWYKVLE